MIIIYLIDTKSKLTFSYQALLHRVAFAKSRSVQIQRTSLPLECNRNDGV